MARRWLQNTIHHGRKYCLHDSTKKCKFQENISLVLVKKYILFSMQNYSTPLPVNHEFDLMIVISSHL